MSECSTLPRNIGQNPHVTSCYLYCQESAVYSPPIFRSVSLLTTPPELATMSHVRSDDRKRHSTYGKLLEETFHSGYWKKHSTQAIGRNIPHRLLEETFHSGYWKKHSTKDIGRNIPHRLLEETFHTGYWNKHSTQSIGINISHRLLE